MRREEVRVTGRWKRFGHVLLFLGGLAVSGSAAGQGWCTAPLTPCDPDDSSSPCYTPPPPSLKCGPKECDSCTESPCFVGSGVFVTDAQDLLVRTPGFGLAAFRHYESSHAIDGPIGFGWSSSLVSRLHYAVYLFAAPSTYQREADIIMPTGARHRFVESTDGAFIPPEGRHDTLVRNADGTFDMIPERSLSRYHFDASGLLVAMTDDYGNALTGSYDAEGRVQRVTDAAGSARYLDVSYGADGRISVVQDNAGRQVQYTYDPQTGGLIRAQDSAGRTTKYTYVPGRFSPLLSQVRDNWDRLITNIAYDATGRVTSFTDNGEAFTYTYRYQDNPGRTAKIDSAGNTWIYPFGTDGLVSDTIPPPGGGGSSHTDYYSDGSIQQFTDAVGVKTFYTYAADGSLLSVTRDYQGPTAVRFDYSYDPSFSGRVTLIRPSDPHWQGWRYDYYQAGDPSPGALHHVYRVQSDGATLELMATYEYDSHGRVTKQTSPTGGITDYVYDVQGNLATVTAPANNDIGTRPVTMYAYDSLGRLTSVSDPMGHTTTYVYDALDRVVTVTLPKPSPSSPLNFTMTYSYDNYDAGTGLIFVNVTDPNGQVTRQGYNQYGQLVRSIDALTNATTYGYSGGLLASATDANGNVTTYGYDSGRRLTSTAFPDSAVERYTYTSDNLLYQKTDRKNQTNTYAYDRHKRLASKGYPDSTSVVYTYQGQKLTQVVDTSVSPSETHVFAYDSSYRVSTNTQGSRGTISYEYKPDDAVATYSIQSGPTASYSYYPGGSLDTIAWTPIAGSFKYAYNLAGQYQTVTFPNDQTRNFAYDDQGRLTQTANVHPTAGNIASYAYGYDLNYATGEYTMLGQRVSMTASVPSASLNNQLFKYEYDRLYELTKATYPSVVPFNGEVDSWTYDAIGNRLTNTVNGSTQSYTYQKIGSNPSNWDRLLSDGVTSYTYDASGNTSTRTGYTLGWDRENRLGTVSGGVSASYGYDYQGRRSGKTVVSSVTSYLYEGLNIAREVGTGSAEYLFGPGIDEPVAMSRGGQVYFYGTDGLGSVNTVTNSAGTVQDSYLYDVWGQTRGETGSLASPFTYVARELGEADTLFYRARYYQPSIGRFFSEDPARQVRGRGLGQNAGMRSDRDPLNVLARWRARERALQRAIRPAAYFASVASSYVYVGNKPVQYSDPLGLDEPGCDPPFPRCLQSPAARACCDQHDECYLVWGCTSQSWYLGWTNPRHPCNMCNFQVVLCMLAAAPFGPFNPSPNGPPGLGTPGGAGTPGQGAPGPGPGPGPSPTSPWGPPSGYW